MLLLQPLFVLAHGYGQNSMAKTDKPDPHKTHNYSHEQLMKFSFEIELAHLRLHKKDDPRKEAVESYLKERFNEIKERWK